jgi:phosphoribosyl 1,2-cyclic phosphodiesterase
LNDFVENCNTYNFVQSLSRFFISLHKKIMIEICALASGSNGNSYYIGNENEAILIDAGIYYKQLLVRLNEAGLNKDKIKAIFVSHEHSDHIQGLRVTTEKLKAAGVLTRQTYLKISDRWKPDRYSFYVPGEAYIIGKITIHPFLKKHDATEPCSFRIETEGKSIGVLTDIGEPDEIVKAEFGKCHAVFLETNYDREMLWNGTYPYILKRRVDSEFGHLSNAQALELTQNHASPDLKTIFLSHLSESNNTPELALEKFACLNGKYNVKLTSRYGISEVIRI